MTANQRAVPYHCPYCSDDNLWPHEAEGVTGAWECRSCLRAFKVTMIGQLSRPSSAGAPDQGGSA